MKDREATCRCGQLRVRCHGDPSRISVCHCLDCKKRSGSAFAAQARWADEDVTITGDVTEWSHTGESGAKATFRFCPRCGSTVFYSTEGLPGSTAVAIGAFADPGFPPPEYSVFEERCHDWVRIVGDGVDHYP